MDSCCPLDASHRDGIVIGDARQGTSNVMGVTMAGSRPQLKTNFSYPRPDGHPTRHEAADSRSSLNSNGSVPGMTDASDSEASVDDDYHYNTSASELWDSFWPTGVEREQLTKKPEGSGITQLPLLNFFTVDYSTPLAEDSEDDTITITQPEIEQPRESKTSQWPLSRKSSTRSPPPRPKAPGNSVTYSVYPKPRPPPLANLGSLPPRTSSLTPEPSPTIAGRFLKGSKSIANLKSAKSIANLHLAPSLLSTSSSFSKATKESRSLPVSPTSPVPHLRSSTSAYSLRDTAQLSATAPLSPLVPATPTIPPSWGDHHHHHQQQQQQQQQQQYGKTCRSRSEPFVSYFDHDDSDAESDAEQPQTPGGGLAKRIARGLQKKGGGARGELGPRKSVTSKKQTPVTPTSTTGGDVSPTESIGRKRGGSLGWILGLKGKSS